MPLIQEAEAEMMAALSEAERALLSDALAKIEDYLVRAAAAAGSEAEES